MAYEVWKWRAKVSTLRIVDGHWQCREEAKRLSGGRTSVPQIFFNDVHIGGNDDLTKAINDAERWARLLAELDRPPPPGAPTPPDPATAQGGLTGDFVCEPDE